MNITTKETLLEILDDCGIGYTTDEYGDILILNPYPTVVLEFNGDELLAIEAIE